jgi:hypothetical protein
MLRVGTHFDNSVPWYCIELEFSVVESWGLIL